MMFSDTRARPVQVYQKLPEVGAAEYYQPLLLMGASGFLDSGLQEKLRVRGFR